MTPLTKAILTIAAVPLTAVLLVFLAAAILICWPVIPIITYIYESRDSE